MRMDLDDECDSAARDDGCDDECDDDLGSEHDSPRTQLIKANIRLVR
jgi:hypothetical protein